MDCAGPLFGLKIIEFAGIGPGPFCGMLLSDLGADVIRIDRKDGVSVGEATLGSLKYHVTSRGRRSVAMDLKKPEAIDACLTLIERADILFEGYRPGVMERLGLAPETCIARNPGLIYGRMTGWGQTGPLSKSAGHDINYVALSGALAAIGTADKPFPPLNLVGDYGGGALYLVLGLLAALIEKQRSGKGQVVDVAMTEGAASLMALFYGFQAAGAWNQERCTNVVDGGASFYDVYETLDNKFVSIGAIEPQFYALLRETLGLDDALFDDQMKQSSWPLQKERIAEAISRKTRDEWCNIMEGTDICFAPVLTTDEAPHHPHNKVRESFVTLGGVTQPNVAPRFGRTPGAIQGPPPAIGEHNQAALEDWGFAPDEIARLEKSGVI